MKHLLAFLFASAACFAGDMVSMTDADFKRPNPEWLKRFEAARPNFDLSKEKDRHALDRAEQELYWDAMFEVSGPFFRLTKLKPGDDWRTIWFARQQAALDEVATDKIAHESLQRSFVILRDFTEERDAMVLERVVKAKFGGEPVWILLVRWEWESEVMKELKAKSEVELGHVLILAVRVSDQKVVSRFRCD